MSAGREATAKVTTATRKMYRQVSKDGISALRPSVSSTFCLSAGDRRLAPSGQLTRDG